VASARSGSRKAFEQLKEVSFSNNSNAALAKDTIDEIRATLAHFQRYPGGVINTPSIAIDGRPISGAREILLAIESLRELAPFQVHGLMGELRHSSDAEILTASAALLERSDSLRACAVACCYLANRFGDKADFLDFDLWLRVCQTELSIRRGDK
jgi:hypothetical protein